jgi:acetyl-CoA carboxylase beta subunit
MPGMDEGFDFMIGGGGVTQLNSSHEVPKWCPHSMKYRIPTRLSISIDEQMVSSLILWLTLHTNIFMKKKKKQEGKINKNKSKFDQSTLCGSRFLYAS